ncbi:carbohydrate phosphatase [Aspergillus candidus]|uniref:Peptide hydrolase n=1 Tax=Aspergillus candidus TaxID=41067 RepID=A0A2I2FIV1_ASPCN|nr:carbohydrate phosphatase [Aspergillus candidus]PLB40539.1 carbohydrate phosphatase [Aspergillus candidus]
MKGRVAFALSAVASSALASVIPQQQVLTNPQIHHAEEKYLIELAPYRTRWVTEEEKWALKLDSVNFIDITAERNTGVYSSLDAAPTVSYPPKMEHSEQVSALSQRLSKDNMKSNLEKFTSFYTRYYKSQTGVESAQWLFDQIHQVLADSGATDHGATVNKFAHSWGQFSIIARIPGQTNRTVVLGAHQDSINLFLPSLLAAPGADDDGSGTVTILESMRTLLQSDDMVQGNALNTVEFHWYSAEEGGMLGSQQIFSKYKDYKRDVKAMLQQDMTGYTKGALSAGREEAIGVMVDYVDQGLTTFMKNVITEYCDIGFIETKCGYACSDHTSATPNQYSESGPSYVTMELTKPYGKELQIACLAVQRATLLTKEVLRAVDKGSLDKSDSSPVTIADFAAQALIIAAVHRNFPQDTFVGEEDATALRNNQNLLERTWQLVSSVHLDDPESEALLYTPATREEMLQLIDLGAQGSCARQGRTWVLDPVDGTATFIQGQQYAVCLSLVEDGCQRLGVTGCPNLNIDAGRIQEDVVDREGYGYQVYAVAGEGAFLRKMGRGTLLPSTRIEPKQQITEPQDVVLVDCMAAESTDFNKHSRFASLIGAPWPPTTDLWATQLRYIAIAVTGCNCLVKLPRKPTYRSKIWDHSGGMLIAQELGCVVSDLAGNPVDCGLGRSLEGCYGMVVAPASIHGRLVEAVKRIL